MKRVKVVGDMFLYKNNPREILIKRPTGARSLDSEIIELLATKGIRLSEQNSVVLNISVSVQTK